MEANGQSNTRVVILAGGFGTRLAEETDIIPKPMVEIGGKPILWHIMKIYAYFGFNEFIIANTLYKVLSSKFKLFKNSKVKTTYRAFVEGGAAGEITDNEVRIEFKKRSFNPILMDWVSSLEEIKKINKRVYRIWVKK